MYSGWMKSLRCRSNDVDDVVCPPAPSSSSAKKWLLVPSLLLSCADSYSHARNDVLPKRPSAASSRTPKPKPRPPRQVSSAPPSPATAVAPAGQFPSLVELPPGHPSRRVVEIIFGSRWCSGEGRATGADAFPGTIEMLFRIHNPARSVARFEEYRAAVRSRAARSDDARCAADGNEMMRFQCRPPASAGEVFDGAVAWSPAGGKAAEGIRTFAGSGGAHQSGGCGGGAGRRSMLVCRVIAGRVRSESDPDSNSARDSVSLSEGELLVFDPRAVLPCFLIIYKL
ncbi:hypothetical protein B296_00014917 [Ensete ventricosum]|uniref:PARP catalytic domain-containing protein n=1 Tax=Ensete ventricosum TaxID=4639 RepID=A0A426YWM9_ENSVE|nr:hypothetical protein B296_00014917 [Ensete ventricosum]